MRTASTRASRRLAGVAQGTWCVLLATSCLAAVVAGWVRFGLLDTDRYVQSMRELARDEVVLDDVQRTIVRSIDEAVDPEGDLRGLLPGPLEAFAAPGAGLAREVLDDVVGRVLRSQLFEEVWVRAARSGHDELRQLLTGGGGSLTNVALDLTPILAAIGDALGGLGVDVGLQIRDRLFLRYELAGRDQVESTRRVLAVLTSLAVWLPLAVALVASVGVVGARRRRRAVRLVALSLGAGGIGALALNAWARSRYLSGRPPDARRAAGHVYDIFTEAPRFAAATLVVAALAVVIGASPRLPATARALAERRRARVAGGALEGA